MTEWKDYIGSMAKGIILIFTAVIVLTVAALITFNLLWWIIYGISTHNVEERIREDRQNIDYGSMR